MLILNTFVTFFCDFSFILHLNVINMALSHKVSDLKQDKTGYVFPRGIFIYWTFWLFWTKSSSQNSDQMSYGEGW